MRRSTALASTLTLVTIAAALLGGCPDDGAARPDADATSGPDGDAVADTLDAGDAGDDADSGAPDSDGSDGDAAAADSHDTITDITAWPWPAEAIAVPASDRWRDRITFPSEPFASQAQSFDRPTPRWVKLTVLVGDPTRVYFQDSVAYPFHYDFAHAELPPFAELSADAFDAVTLDGLATQRAVLGAIMFAPDASFGGAPVAREVGVTLVGRAPYPAVVVETVLALVRDHLDVSDGGAPPETFYFPSFEQSGQALLDADRLAAAGFPVSDAGRWASGDVCYARGWAIGRLASVPAAEIEQAYADGRLGPTDILLTDGVPAEVPFVAGIVSTAPSTPSSHVAILADTFGVPFTWLATPASRARAEALVGRLVALRVEGYAGSFGGCSVSFIDLEGRLDAAAVDALRDLKRPEPLDFPPKATLGATSREAAQLTAADIRFFGGKAAHFGLLRRTIPEASPTPALALSFDLWDRVVGPERAAIDARLASYGWPADVARLRADLEAVRTLVKGLSIPADVAADVRAALEAAGFDSLQNIRFRSSTNVEDQASFTGAGLYDSYSGCLADDTDADADGPSRCDPSEPDERGVLRAIKKVYASFWNENAFLERLRHGVDEAEVAMGLLVHPSYPDAFERANGVVTLRGGNGGSLAMTVVTQLGAVSVTNPDSAAQPEVVDINVYGFGTYLDLVQQSSLVPLGGHVMAWEDDYQALAALIARVAAAWARDVAPAGTAYALDLEWKLVARPGEEARLEVKQVRPLPRPSTTRDVAPFLLPEAPLARCTFQGEHGSVWGNWRLKARATLAHGATWLDAASRAVTFYDDVRVERAAGVAVDGDPTTFAGALHEPGTIDQYGTATAAADGWVVGAGPARESWSLRTTLPWLVAESESPLLTFDDADLSLEVTYATPQRDPDAWPDGTTTFDSTRLVPCPETTVITPAHPAVHRTAAPAGSGVSVDIRFYWPPVPTGISAGYTAPLAKWDATTITGLTASPIVLRGYWSQTYRPGHHNFTETFIFEPALEEDLDAALVAELAAKDIRALVVEVGYEVGTIQLLGFDGALRPLPE